MAFMDLWGAGNRLLHNGLVDDHQLLGIARLNQIHGTFQGKLHTMYNHVTWQCTIMSVAKPKPVSTLMLPTILGWKHLQVSFPLVPLRPSAVAGRVWQSPVISQVLEVLQNCTSYTGYFWLANSAFWYLYHWEGVKTGDKIQWSRISQGHKIPAHHLLQAGLLHFFLRANQVWWSVWRLPRTSRGVHLSNI